MQGEPLLLCPWHLTRGYRRLSLRIAPATGELHGVLNATSLLYRLEALYSKAFAINRLLDQHLGNKACHVAELLGSWVDAIAVNQLPSFMAKRFNGKAVSQDYSFLNSWQTGSTLNQETSNAVTWYVCKSRRRDRNDVAF